MSREIYKTLVVEERDLPLRGRLAELGLDAYFILSKIKKDNNLKIEKNKSGRFFGTIKSIKELENKYNCICLITW